MKVLAFQILRRDGGGRPSAGTVEFPDGLYSWRRHVGSGELFFAVNQEGAGGNDRFWFRSRKRSLTLEAFLAQSDYDGSPA